MAARLLLLPLAIGLDALLGDPPGWPHPVRLIGACLDRLKPLAPTAPLARRIYGAACLCGLGFAVWLLVRIVTYPSGLIGYLAALYLSYAGLALGCLMREGIRVSRLLSEGKLSQARASVAQLVSREVAGLDEDGLRRALAETLSENLCDGFTAPLFYLSPGGPALLWLYKCVSTFDSMWGYKNAEFRELGWAGARADDLLNFVPARLTALSMLLAARLMGLKPPGLWRLIRGDAAKSASPNAGWSMAAAAWIVGAQMGGPAVYFGRKVEKPRLGPPGRAWREPEFAKLLKLLPLSSALFSLTFWLFCEFR